MKLMLITAVAAAMVTGVAVTSGWHARANPQAALLASAEVASYRMFTIAGAEYVKANPSYAGTLLWGRHSERVHYAGRRTPAEHPAHVQGRGECRHVRHLR
jgi:hypothetical protein